MPAHRPTPPGSRQPDGTRLLRLPVCPASSPPGCSRPETASQTPTLKPTRGCCCEAASPEQSCSLPLRTTAPPQG
ncbi:hypothetical protein FMN52_13005 [Marinobacter sp. BW6]|nr:hypothetical protein FMN52_13005 [Marinobacter sp. BW6]